MRKERSFESYQEEYRALPFERHQAKLRRKELLEMIESLSPKHIVEVGCGDAPLFTNLQDFEKMLVIEPGHMFADNAKKLATNHRHHEKIQVSNGLLEDFCDEEVSADVVVLSALLHEVPSPSLFLRQAITLGNENCRYLITVPNAHSFHRQLALRAGLIESLTDLSEQQVKLQQSRTYTEESLREELASAGLTVLSIEDKIFKPFTHGQMEAILQNGLLTEDQMYCLCDMADLAPGSGSEYFVVSRSS